ncbi:MAG: hypothetical protein M0Q99_09020 [Candidatus Cloacimonetes bacterium]|nr:hypothetical protein [Candidatus Cloacimonadota bacterium]
MGTQQILLIVLSVIIVGVAIAVGISMFNSQAYNANKTAIAADAQSFGTQVLQYYKTPESQGGAGGDSAKMTVANVAGYLGFNEDETGGAGSTHISNENGTYGLSVVAAGTDITITGIGTATRGGTNPKIVTTVAYATDEVTAVASDYTP